MYLTPACILSVDRREVHTCQKNSTRCDIHNNDSSCYLYRDRNDLITAVSTVDKPHTALRIVSKFYMADFPLDFNIVDLVRVCREQSTGFCRRPLWYLHL